jgi:hypothetical protein
MTEFEETMEIVKELNENIAAHKQSIEKLKYDLESYNLSDESVYAIGNQISWYEGAINFDLVTIAEIN